MHRLWMESDLAAALPGQTLKVTGDEAHHALKVKRLAPGDGVELLDGAGTIAAATLLPSPAPARKTPPTLLLLITALRRAEPVLPRVDVFAATPKAARADEMVDALSQAGAASWTPLRCERSVVEPRPAKLDRLRRIALEATKQSGRPWTLDIYPERALADLLTDAAPALTILADATGAPLALPPETPPIRLLIGPEGGFTPAELAAARAAGVAIHRFGPHTMRIETAAVAAVAAILNYGCVNPTQGARA